MVRCGLCQFRMLWLEPWEGHLWFELTLYFVTSLLVPPFLRYYTLFRDPLAFQSHASSETLTQLFDCDGI